MLTVSQIEARRGKLTASRVACLMTGDVQKIMQLWLEMTGQAYPEDLRHVWPVRLGEVTEQLQLDWYEEHNGIVSRRGEVVVHPKWNWAAATIDGWIDALGCPIEAKHVGGREPLEIVIDRYAPQTQWQMFCTNASECALSVIMGANEPVIEFLPRDGNYINEMVSRGQQFMECVRSRTPPVALDPVPAPADASKIYEMTNMTGWKESADIWLQTYGAAMSARDSEKLLKSLVPADAKKCFGNGVRITRDRAGRLSLRKDT